MIEVYVRETGPNCFEARCHLKKGLTVIVSESKTPIYAMARRLDIMGYGDLFMQSFVGKVPSIRGRIGTLAGISVVESEGKGLRRQKFRPFPGCGVFQDGD